MENNILEKLSDELGLPKTVIEKTYMAYWKYIKMQIEVLPLKEDLTEEQFNKLKTNFNIPYLGKLAVTYDRYKRVKEKYKKYSDDKHKEN